MVPAAVTPCAGRREVTSGFSVPDSEDIVCEAACGCFGNSEEFNVRCPDV